MQMAQLAEVVDDDEIVQENEREYGKRAENGNRKNNNIRTYRFLLLFVLHDSVLFLPKILPFISICWFNFKAKFAWAHLKSDQKQTKWKFISLFILHFLIIHPSFSRHEWSSMILLFLFLLLSTFGRAEFSSEANCVTNVGLMTIVVVEQIM